ncbi:protein disulfide isomerase family protein [Planctomycetota bacterium]
MKSISDIVLKLLGLLLLTGAVLKGWQLLTEPVANNTIWSYRPFLILVVEFELALAIWLLSGLFKKAAWLVTLGCFSLFSLITLYKGLSGAESCGCFGSIHVNPWITLFAIDIPAVIALVVFRPELSFLKRQQSVTALVRNLAVPLPSMLHFITIAVVGLIALAITTPILALNEPAKETEQYIVLEPETWIGQKLPILENIDIGEQLKKGNWLVLFYHHDCPDCIKAIPKYEQIAHDLKGNEDFLQIALIEVPPYGQELVSENSPCVYGKLPDTKEWFITTPAAALLDNSTVTKAWEAQAPSFENIIGSFAVENYTSNEKTINN